jgi:hypothetical protein
MNDYKLGEFNLCAMDNNLTMHKTPIICTSKYTSTFSSKVEGSELQSEETYIDCKWDLDWSHSLEIEFLETQGGNRPQEW